jgi:hypothetical protein
LRLAAETGGTQIVRKVLTVKDVVAQDQAARVFADELFANDESLRQTVRTRLLGIGQLDAVQAAVTQQLAEAWQSSGVEIIRISRIPASISTDSG